MIKFFRKIRKRLLTENKFSKYLIYAIGEIILVVIGILIEYDKMDKTHHVEMIEDFTAIIFQHEIDHLNGVLYLQYLDGVLREEALK